MTHVPYLNETWIDQHALDIVKTLQGKSFTTYLVGGCVRDLLLGLHPKDFDIATSALPKEVNRIIRPSYVIGRRFRLVLIKRQGKQFEVSTFRAQTLNGEEAETGVILDDNTFGSPEEDALRRDFTINGLFYDPVACDLIDYTDGLKDIESRTIRMIGDPETRIAEDPIRILRALRFAHKVNFQMEPVLRKAIHDMSSHLDHAVLPRKREEILKLLRLHQPHIVFWEAFDLNILEHLCPTLHQTLKSPEMCDTFSHQLAVGIPKVSDKDNPNELFGVLVFSYLWAKYESFRQNFHLSYEQRQEATQFMRAELGMFRVEQELFFQGINLIKQLQDIKDPAHLKEKHRLHLVKNNSLALALTLSSAYKLLSSQQLYYWLDQYWKFHS